MLPLLVTGSISLGAVVQLVNALPEVEGTSSGTNCESIVKISHGSIYQATANQSYLVTCHNDMKGGDMAIIPAPTFKDCFPACEAIAACMGFTWLSGEDQGECFLKSGLPSGIYPSNGDLAIKMGVFGNNKGVVPASNPPAPAEPPKQPVESPKPKPSQGQLESVPCAIDSSTSPAPRPGVTTDCSVYWMTFPVETPAPTESTPEFPTLNFEESTPSIVRPHHNHNPTHVGYHTPDAEPRYSTYHKSHHTPSHQGYITPSQHPVHTSDSPTRTRKIFEPTHPAGDDPKGCEKMSRKRSFRIVTEVISGAKQFGGLYLSANYDIPRQPVFLTPYESKAAGCIYNSATLTVSQWHGGCEYAGLSFLEGGNPKEFGECGFWRNTATTPLFLSPSNEITWNSDSFGGWLACEFRDTKVLRFYEDITVHNLHGGGRGNWSRCATVRLLGQTR